MRLRTAVREDVPTLVALEQTLFGPDAWSQKALLLEVEGESGHSVVADDGGDVVGYAVTFCSGDLADLQRIGVRPDRQRRGVARTLLEEALTDAVGRGANRVLLEVSALNAAALAFYAAAGFVEIDRRPRYYRDGSDAVVMRRALGRAACGGRGQ